MRLAGRVVVITGAASGIGRETALRAAGEGAIVAAIDIDEDGLAKLTAEVAAAGGHAGARRADVSDPSAITAAVDDLVGGPGTSIHAVFASAGTLTERSTVTELDLGEWHRVLAVDLTGVLLTFRAAIPHFGPDGGALLACGSSLAIRPGVGLLPYVAAKAGVHAMARSLALELAPRGIRVNVLAPGLTDTPMTRGIEGHIERARVGAARALGGRRGRGGHGRAPDDG